MAEQASPRARNPQSGESRRERNKRDKLARIVAAARALFQTQGYDKTTTQQIARAAEIASGTLFLYAKSKEDLLLYRLSRTGHRHRARVDPRTHVSEQS
jgi:AcrR family transcriptional regulator